MTNCHVFLWIFGLWTKFHNVPVDQIDAFSDES